MREQLLGYLLGALEPDEQAAVAARLAQEPQLRRELEALQAKLAPLDDDEVEMPAGLAGKTCAYVADQRGPEAGEFGASSHWRVIDLCVASALFIAAALLILPAICESRSQAHLTACQRNLATLGLALGHFSSIHQEHFPEVPTSGKLAVAGIYAPLLHEAGLIEHTAVICPASPLRKAPQFRIPTTNHVQQAEGELLQEMQRLMGGSYGYCIGYVKNGTYRAHRNLGRSTFALVADTPIDLGESTASHHGCGYNVLFEDGHVQYVRGCSLNSGSDHFFQNRLGHVAAGVDVDDAVILPSAARPLILRTSLGDE